jgi:hypothetical protein
MLWRPVLSPVVVMEARFLARYRFPWRWVSPRSCARTRGGAAVYILRMPIQERDYSAPSVAPMAVGSLLQNWSSFPKSAFRMMDRSSLVPVSLCHNARRYTCICSFVFHNQKHPDVSMKMLCIIAYQIVSGNLHGLLSSNSMHPTHSGLLPIHFHYY